jgi:hypothetical protein
MIFAHENFTIQRLLSYLATIRSVHRLISSPDLTLSLSLSLSSAPQMDYTSDAHSQQANIMSGFDVTERKAQALRNKNMKTGLTSTNFSLGDAKVDYETTSKAGQRHAATGPSKNQAAVSIPAQKSSIDFGRETPTYRSVAQVLVQVISPCLLALTPHLPPSLRKPWPTKGTPQISNK